MSSKNLSSKKKVQKLTKSASLSKTVTTTEIKKNW